MCDGKYQKSGNRHFFNALNTGQPENSPEVSAVLTTQDWQEFKVILSLTHKIENPSMTFYDKNSDYALLEVHIFDSMVLVFWPWY